MINILKKFNFGLKKTSETLTLSLKNVLLTKKIDQGSFFKLFMLTYIF